MSRSIQEAGIDVDAIADLLDIKADFVGRLCATTSTSSILPGLHLDAAVGDVVNDDDGMAGDGEMFLYVLSAAAAMSGPGRREKPGASTGRMLRFVNGPDWAGVIPIS